MAVKKTMKASMQSYADAMAAAMERARDAGTVIREIRHDDQGYRTFYDFDGSQGETHTVTIAQRGTDFHGMSCSCPARTICKHQGAVKIYQIAQQDAQIAEAQAQAAQHEAAIIARPVDASGPFLFRGEATPAMLTPTQAAQVDILEAAHAELLARLFPGAELPVTADQRAILLAWYPSAAAKIDAMTRQEAQALIMRATPYTKQERKAA